MNPKPAALGGVERAVAVGQYAGREPQLEGDALRHLPESRVVLRPTRERRYLHGLFTSYVSGGVDRVDANVLNRSTAKRLAESDVRGLRHLAVARRECPQLTDGLVPAQLHDGPVERLVV